MRCQGGAGGGCCPAEAALAHPTADTRSPCGGQTHKPQARTHPQPSRPRGPAPRDDPSLPPTHRPACCPWRGAEGQRLAGHPPRPRGAPSTGPTLLALSLQTGRPRPGWEVATCAPRRPDQRSAPSCPPPPPTPSPPPLALSRKPGFSLLTGQRPGPQGIMGKQFHLYVGSSPTRFATFCLMAEPAGRLQAVSASFLLLAGTAWNLSSGFGQNRVLLPVQAHTLLPAVSEVGARAAEVITGEGPCECLGPGPHSSSLPRQGRGQGPCGGACWGRPSLHSGQEEGRRRAGWTGEGRSRL